MEGQFGFSAMAGGGKLQSEMMCAGHMRQEIGCPHRTLVLCSLVWAPQPLRTSGWKE